MPEPAARTATARPLGRLVGGLLLLQLAGFIVPFVLLLPIVGGWQDAPSHATQLRVAIAWLYVNGALTVTIAVLLHTTLRRAGEQLGIWLVVAAVVMMLTQAVDNAALLSLLSLAVSGGTPSAAEAVATTRDWHHNNAIIAIDAWLMLLYLALWHTYNVPRLLSGLGLVTVALHFAAIPARSFLALEPVAILGMPMGISQLALAGWLMLKGFPSKYGERHVAA